jgi:hypothetical protein
MKQVAIKLEPHVLRLEFYIWFSKIIGLRSFSL